MSPMDPRESSRKSRKREVLQDPELVSMSSNAKWAKWYDTSHPRRVTLKIVDQENVRDVEILGCEEGLGFVVQSEMVEFWEIEWVEHEGKREYGYRRAG